MKKKSKKLAPIGARGDKVYSIKNHLTNTPGSSIVLSGLYVWLRDNDKCGNANATMRFKKSDFDKLIKWYITEQEQIEDPFK